MADVCRGGQFDGLRLVTARDKQLCVEGGGTVEPSHVVRPEFPEFSWQFPEFLMASALRDQETARNHAGPISTLMTFPLRLLGTRLRIDAAAGQSFDITPVLAQDVDTALADEELQGAVLEVLLTASNFAMAMLEGPGSARADSLVFTRRLYALRRSE